jgi:transcriptional regulator with XRE-family HTH domain
VTRKASKPPSSGENPEFYAALGLAIKVLRTEREISRKQLAASAGVSYPYLADIESGRGRPSSSALIKISGALELEASELLSAAERFVERLASEERSAPVAPPAATPSPSWFRTDPRSRASTRDRTRSTSTAVTASGPAAATEPAEALPGPIAGGVRMPHRDSLRRQGIRRTEDR